MKFAAGFVHVPPPGDGWLRHSEPVRPFPIPRARTKPQTRIPAPVWNVLNRPPVSTRMLDLRMRWTSWEQQQHLTLFTHTSRKLYTLAAEILSQWGKREACANSQSWRSETETDSHSCMALRIQPVVNLHLVPFPKKHAAHRYLFVLLLDPRRSSSARRPSVASAETAVCLGRSVCSSMA